MIWQAETHQKVMQFNRLAINLPRLYFRSFDREQVDPNLRVTNGLQPSYGCKLPTWVSPFWRKRLDVWPSLSFTEISWELCCCLPTFKITTCSIVVQTKGFSTSFFLHKANTESLDDFRDSAFYRFLQSISQLNGHVILINWKKMKITWS